MTKVQETVQKKSSFAVMHVCDAATVVISDTHPQRALAVSGQYSIDDLERMGVGKRREAILVSLETPGYRLILKQYYDYDRGAGGALVLQERTDVDSDSPEWNGGAQGRFLDFFLRMAAYDLPAYLAAGVLEITASPVALLNAGMRAPQFISINH